MFGDDNANLVCSHNEDVAHYNYDFKSDHERKISSKNKIKRILTRYIIPIVCIILGIGIILAGEIFLAYDFDSRKFDLAKMLLYFPILTLGSGFISCTLSYWWLKFITSNEDH